MPAASSEVFEISRVYDAPRARVWQAWTEAERLKQWWGPVWGRFVYREIVKPERLVFIVSFSDPKGGVTRNPWTPDWPLETLSTVLFAEKGGKTTVTVQWLPHNATDAERKVFSDGKESMQQGWTGTLDQLAAHLEQTGVPLTAKEN